MCFPQIVFYLGSLFVAEWLRAWDTLTMFEATVCGRRLFFFGVRIMLGMNFNYLILWARVEVFACLLA